MKRNELTIKVKETVKLIDPRAILILFGSKARRDDRTSSDWDFLVLTSFQVNEKIKRQIRNSLIDTELEAEEVINTVIFSKDQWSKYFATPLYKNIKKDGIEI